MKLKHKVIITLEWSKYLNQVGTIMEKYPDPVDDSEYIYKIEFNDGNCELIRWHGIEPFIRICK